MVDFKNRLAGKKQKKPIDPVVLYETLDRAHDKGPLRPAQSSVLLEWFENGRKSRDVIVKLHTGQGKTLVGLLMLQAGLNDDKGPALYLCPNNFLIEQTCDQAKQFGIATCKASPELPDEFLNGDKILVTSVQKMFNGLTKFGLNHKSLSVGTLLMDDAHACTDSIREACRIRIPKDEAAYSALKDLFSEALEQQGIGTFADICNGKREAVLPVPYWAWLSCETDVAKILSGNVDRGSTKFAWPLLKDMLRFCQCVISGVAIEIEPYIPPLFAFGSYWKAPHRIFMSATVTDDAFLVKGLQLLPKTILNPITYDKESWSGEKMVLLPSIINESLQRETIVKLLGAKSSKRKYGFVALVPSFSKTADWGAYGAKVADTYTVTDVIDCLRVGEYEETVVLANRYDGIDLPDDVCRILIFDGKPYSESLIDLYQESCRPTSEATLMRTIRTVEQGMGRSVRGEKDYSVIVVIGTDITKLIRGKLSREHLSPQMSAQIEIGLDLAEMARQEIADGEEPLKSLRGLIRQCLTRDDDWKAFYAEQMEGVKPKGANKYVLSAYASELEAENAYMDGDDSRARDILQSHIDNGNVNLEDKAWYLQEMARFCYISNRVESEKLQIAAHKSHHLLLRPQIGVTTAKLTIVSHGRVERIADWVSQFENYTELNIYLSDILGRLTFGAKADHFELSLDEISRALGFDGERPDKEWKQGPDNLWALDDTHYIFWECKNEVKTTRAEINKREAEQMNRSSAWFDKHYPGMKVKRVMIHPSNRVESAAAFTHEVEIMRVGELNHFVKAIRKFYSSFESANFRDLSMEHTQKQLNSYSLAVSDFLNSYTKKPKESKSL